MSSLPLGLNQIEIQRGLTTSSVAIFVPFTTQELFQNGSEALYYGINALSNNLIMVDRKLLKNPNGLILGTPGSGKSFSAKREITNAFLICPKDDIIICDPEGEYTPLVERLHGQVIKLSPTGKGYDGSPCYINPMDLNLDYSDDDNPLSLKSDFILSLCELIVGGKDGLAPVEKTIIDRCVRIVYRDYLNDPKPENMPLLEDLYNALRAQDEKEAQYIATALEIYVTGSLNVFNHHTNVDVNSRIVCYDIKELGKQLKKIGMLVVQDQVWNRVTINRAAHKMTRYYVWGDSSPSTSFDCSGFVSWVINHSGWDVGRLGAQGLCNICTPVSSANVKPGDLVFFTGTYDTPGVSHVGIYVGNNMMIHCGDPISYANLNSNYWQSHFYRYGRLP